MSWQFGSWHFGKLTFLELTFWELTFQEWHSGSWHFGKNPPRSTFCRHSWDFYNPVSKRWDWLLLQNELHCLCPQVLSICPIFRQYPVKCSIFRQETSFVLCYVLKCCQDAPSFGSTLSRCPIFRQETSLVLYYVLKCCQDAPSFGSTLSRCPVPSFGKKHVVCCVMSSSNVLML